MKNPGLKRPFAESEWTMQRIQELKRCQEDPIYFITNYVMIQHPTKGTIPMALFDYQLEMIDTIHNNKDSIILASRQLGKTTVVAMYMLWVTTFNPDKLCVIASKNMGHAVEIMQRVKFAYEELPEWLKAGCKFYNRTSIEFDNGSRIKSEATSDKTGRGNSPSIIYIDEIAFVRKRIQEEMWSSLAPSLSTGGKVIITSTPNGDTDLFATLWRGAMAGLNSFKPLQVMWYQHPERDQRYYDEMKGKLGPVKTRQELDCDFVSSDALLISSLKLNQLRATAPVWESLGFKFWVPEEEIGGRNRTYLVFLDPATGSGNDASAIEVFEFPGLRQVAEYRTTDVKIPLIYAKLKWVLALLSAKKGNGRAEVLWSFERNGIGEAIGALYFNDDRQPEHADLLCDPPQKLGVFTSGKSKIQSCLQLKELIERGQDAIDIRSEHLLFELKNFVAKGGSYEAKAGATDDCVMATVGIMRLLHRLSTYNDEAFKQVNLYVEADADQADDAPMPFMVV
jgi:hypothetical protein